MDTFKLQKMMDTDEGIAEFKKNLLDLDSTFRFKCRKCGKCCRHQNTIILTPRDIFRIARKENERFTTVLCKYTETYIGTNSFLPIVHLLPRGPREECPFLTKDGLCSIQECKPTVCALFPLGRVFVSDTISNQSASSAEPQAESSPVESRQMVRYILTSHDCGSKKQYTVREWLQKNHVPEDDWFFVRWSKLMADLSTAVRTALSNNIDHPKMPTLMDCLDNFMYDYTIEKDFEPQFETSEKYLRDLIQRLNRKKF